MPQPPFLLDQLDIEPGSAGTRRINRDPGTGGLAFNDPTVSSALTLLQLAGMRNVANVLVVGKQGAGAQHTTIQSAIDAVPASSSATNPHIVMVMPGRYDETVNIARDGIHLVGIGQPELRSALESTPNAVGNDHTLVISNALGTPPQFCLIQGFKVTNAHDNKACVRVTGGAASTLLQTDGLFLRDVSLHSNSAGGNYSLWGTAAGWVTADNCTFTGSNALSLLLLQEMSRCIFRDCAVFNGVHFRYDTTNDQPAGAGGDLFLQNCPGLASSSALSPAVNIDCDGDGSSTIHNCTVNGSPLVQYSGDQTHYVRNSYLGEISLLETTTVEAPATKFDSIAAANANAVLDRDVVRGTASFAAVSTAAVAFDIPMPDADYVVDVECPSRPVNDETPWVTLKAGTGFTINFNTAQTMLVEWRATRR